MELGKEQNKLRTTLIFKMQLKFELINETYEKLCLKKSLNYNVYDYTLKQSTRTLKRITEIIY